MESMFDQSLQFQNDRHELNRFIEIGNDSLLLYRFGPSSKQNVKVRVASSSKNSVAKASHQRLSLSCRSQLDKSQ